MQISEATLIFVIAQTIATFALVWKFASAWGGLKQADKENADDINGLGKKMRRMDRLTWQRMDHIEYFLNQHHGYSPPSLNIFDEDK